MSLISGAKLGMHLLEAEITTRCNLDCQHCYNRNREVADMSVGQVLSLLEFAEEKGVSSFVVSGGEASLHPEFDRLAENLLERKTVVRTVLQTNGIASVKSRNLLKAFKVIHISYEPDGSDVRRVVGERLIEFALDLKENGIYAYLFATIHQGNIDKVDVMVESANKAGIDIGFNLCVLTHESPELTLLPIQALQVSRKLHDLFLQKKILRFTSPLVSILHDRKPDGYIGNRGGCTAGIAACSVTVNGDVMPCPFFREIIAGNIHQQSMERIWFDSLVFKSLRDRSQFKEPCGSCDHLSFCGGCRKRAFNSSGSLTGQDPGCFVKLL